MPTIDYSQYNAQARATGAKAGRAQAELLKQQQERERKLRMEQRYAQLAQDKQMQQDELARTEYANAVKAQALEADDFGQHESNGWIDQNDMYTEKYFEDKAYEEWTGRGIKRTTEEENAWRTDPNGMAAAVRNMKSGHKKYKIRQYKKGAAETAFRQQLQYNQQVMERDMNTPVYSEGMQGAGERLGDALVDKIFGSDEGPQAPQAQPMEQDPRANERFATTDREQTTVGHVEDAVAIKRNQMEKVQIQGQAGVYFLDKERNEVMGPGTNGQWMPAGNVQMLPQERKPLTMDYTDKNTGEEMTGTLIETFPNDPDAVLVRGGKAYAPMATPTKKHGSQDQHGPAKLSKAQNTDLVARDSSTNVQSLSQDVLSQDYVSNPAGWLAARMSSVTDMFASVVPGLTGATDDIEPIVDYINSNLSEDAKANSELGVLDARAIAEGDHVATTKLLSYATALWMNGGTRITTKVSEDAAEISQSWLSGTSAHKGKIASLRNQASKRYARIANRHLSMPEDNVVWDQYPTAKRKKAQGWDIATDKADGYSLQHELNRLKKSDPEAYSRSVASLDSTLASFDTLTTPIFWSDKYGTNVAIYHKTDPKTGAIRFATFKVE